MTTTQTERIERAVYDLRQHQPGPRPDHTPAPAAAPPRDPTNPIAHLTDDQLDDLTQNLLEDWDNPIFTPLGLCRAHRLSLSQIQAIAARPIFTDALARIRAINAARRADIEARAHQIALERLCALCDQHPTGATHTKELRLTIKQLLALIAPTPTDPTPTSPTPTSPDRKGGDVFNPQQPTISAPKRQSPNSPDRKGGDGFNAQQHSPRPTQTNQTLTPPDRKGGDGFDAQQHNPRPTQTNQTLTPPDRKGGDGFNAQRHKLLSNNCNQPTHPPDRNGASPPCARCQPSPQRKTAPEPPERQSMQT